MCFSNESGPMTGPWGTLALGIRGWFVFKVRCRAIYCFKGYFMAKTDINQTVNKIQLIERFFKCTCDEIGLSKDCTKRRRVMALLTGRGRKICFTVRKVLQYWHFGGSSPVE